MTNNSFKLGCSAALSGCEEKHGQAMLKSVELAVEEAKSSGLLYNLELAFHDDAGDTEQGIAVAKKLIADPEVMGVVGPMNSNPAIGAAPLYDQAGLVHITNSASNVALSEQGYKTFFRMIANDYVQSDALVDFMVNHLKAKEIAVINDDTDFSSGLGSLVKEKAASADLKVTNHIQVTCGKGDYSLKLSPLKASRPGVIFFAILEPEGRLISNQLREFGNRSVFLGTDALKPSKFLVTSGFDVPGPYHSCASTDIARDPAATDFASAYENKYGEKYSIYTAEAYDAANIIIRAINNCQNVSREEVLKQVSETINFYGASGETSFTDCGELAHPRISFYNYENGDLNFIGFFEQNKQ